MVTAEVIHMRKAALAAAAAFAIAASASAEIRSAEAARLAAAARVTREIHESIAQEYWDKARCVVVIPELKKAAFIVGGEYGKGVMSCRAGERWGAPVFIQLAKGSWGFQAGAEQVDVVMLVMNDSGVQKLLENKVMLGADASVAAGPLGRQGKVATDAGLTSEIVSYSRAKGLFAGIDLSGGILRQDEDANRDVYGPTATPRSILASREIAAPTEAAPFLDALNVVSAPAPEQRAAATPARPSVVLPTTDSDLRVRLVDMQQTLGRLMAEAGQRSVGTVGNADAGGQVTVDRSQLAQLQRELEAALAALNQR